MKKTTTNNKAKKPTQDDTLKNIILVSVGLTATGIAGYFGYQYLKKQKEQQAKAPLTTFTPPETTPTYTQPKDTNTYTPPVYEEPIYKPKDTSKTNSSGSSKSSTWSEPKPKSDFPLKRGSKGTKVRDLQLALMATYGKSILPKYGADGDFGSELAKGLKKLKYPTIISESLFHVITNGKASTNSLAKQFYGALNKTDYTTTMSLLKQMNSIADYNTVSNEFKSLRLHGGVRQTLVNGVLNTFSDTTQKQNIRLEFIRMGLKYNGKKWSLSGLGSMPNGKIITIQPTQVWLDGYNQIPVPSNMILGTAVGERLDLTLFEKDKRYFLVRTATVRKL